TARMRPNVKTEPPRIGPSIRYQTSSIRKNAKPTTADAVRTKLTGAKATAVALSGAADDSAETASENSGGGMTDANLLATTATMPLRHAASHNVSRVPNVSSMKKVASRQPLTAPKVLRP